MDLTGATGSKYLSADPAQYEECRGGGLDAALYDTHTLILRPLSCLCVADLRPINAVIST